MFVRLLTCVVVLTVATCTARAGEATDARRATEPASLFETPAVDSSHSHVTLADPSSATLVAKPPARCFRQFRLRPPAAKRSSLPKASQFRYVVVKGHLASDSVSSPLDDEVEAPDDAEDDDPGRPDEALESGGRSYESVFGLLTSGTGTDAPRFPSRPLGPAPDARPHACLVSLCRLLC